MRDFEGDVPEKKGNIRQGNKKRRSFWNLLTQKTPRRSPGI